MHDSYYFVFEILLVCSRAMRFALELDSTFNFCLLESERIRSLAWEESEYF